MTDQPLRDADYAFICEDVPGGLGEAFRQQDRHFAQHHEPVDGCWYCEHSDGA